MWYSLIFMIYNKKDGICYPVFLIKAITVDYASASISRMIIARISRISGGVILRIILPDL